MSDAMADATPALTDAALAEMVAVAFPPLASKWPDGALLRYLSTFDPPTAAALCHEVMRLRALLAVSNASVENVAAKVKPILDENAQLKAELARVAPFLAIHRFPGYRLEGK